MAEPPISRGFRGRKPADDTSGRVPPGQHLTSDFPVLSAGPTPRRNLDTWSFTLEEGDKVLAEWSWAAVIRLARTPAGLWFNMRGARNLSAHPAP